MNVRRAWVSVSLLSLVLGAGAAGLGLLPEQPSKSGGQPTSPAAVAGPYAIDAVHSFVVFKIRHGGIGNAYGMIHGPTGSFTIDPANPSASKVEVVLKADKVSTGNQGRDDHIRRPDFFNVAEYPTMTFKSTGFKAAGANKFEVTGDMTFLGQTRPVTAMLEVIGSGPAMRGGGHAMGIEAAFTIKRSDFGNNVMIGPLGDEVTLTVAIEGVHK